MLTLEVEKIIVIPEKFVSNIYLQFLYAKLKVV